MPAAANKQPGDIILASEWNTLATTANNGESGAASAQTAAASALTKANAAYVKPAQGIPASDLASGALPSNVQGGATNPWTDMSQRNSSLTKNHYLGTKTAFDAGSGPVVGDVLWLTGS